MGEIMQRKYLPFIVIFIMLLLGNAQFADAQPKQRGTRIDTSYNYVPEFYRNDYSRVADTLLRYVAYDSRDSVIKYIDDYEKVRYYSLFKEYTDSAHTYKDKNGVKQFLPISFITRRYDRLGKNRWMCIEYPGNKYHEYKDDRNTIVEEKILLIDTNNDNVADLAKVLYYYRLIPSEY